MKNNLLLRLLSTYVLVALMFYVSAHAQTAPKNANPSDPTLFTFGGTPVTKSEFIGVYEKLNSQDEALYSQKSVNDYLELYTNFKLKVREAEAMGLDTTASMQVQLNDYRKQLAPNYLYDKQISDNLVKEAYDRLSKEVAVSHILIACKEDASPVDTTIAHKKAMGIYYKTKSPSANFGELAKELSDDPSAKDNNGSLGYITVLQTVYPFETAAYNTPRGNISKPVRTKFGYHILKTGETRPARGRIQVAHIYLALKPTDSPEKQKEVEERIIAAQAELRNEPENFEGLAKRISEDRNSSMQGGKLDWFGVGKMFPEFEDAAFALKNKGDISAPVKTPIGWHIIKLLDKKTIGTYEQSKDDLRRRIEKDSRSRISKKTFIAKLQKDYQFSEIKTAKSDFKKLINSDVLHNKWKAELIGNKPNEMFSLVLPYDKKSKKSFTQNDFAKYVEASQNKIRVSDSATAVDRLYNMFVENTILSLEEAQLENKQPEFAKLIKEFRDGNLLYELMDKKVWKYALADTSGLKNFYNANAQKYQWNERAEAAILTLNNKEIAEKYAQSLTDTDIYQLEKDLKTSGKLSDAKIEVRSFERGQNQSLDALSTWKKGINGPIAEKDGKFTLIKIQNVIPAGTKKLEEARGFVIADYQTLLEKKWIDELKQKYPVKVNETVLKSIYKK